MVQVDLIDILIFAAGGAAGAFGAFVYARMYYRNKTLSSILAVKNPEMWDLGHMLAVEEDEKKKQKDTQRQTRRRPPAQGSDS